MGKRSRARKRQAEAAALAAAIPSVPPGGIMGVRHRAANGRATLEDIDFLERLNRESHGRNGHTGEIRGSSSYFVKSDHSTRSSGWLGGSSSSEPDKYKFHVQPAKDDTVFHCAESNELTKECPIANVPSILIDTRMWDCFLQCTKEYDTEWIALLLGRLDKDSQGDPAYVIDKFYFPPQVASGAHVEVPTGVKPRPGVIGAIHSHVGMAAFWSATDTAHSNWPVEIVINRREEYEALARHQLKCGQWAKNKTKVYLTGTKVSEAVAKEIKIAFDKGKELEAAARASANSKPSVPAGVAEEDKAEVAEAIVTSTGANTVTLCPVPACMREKGHNGWCKRTSDLTNKLDDYFKPDPAVKEVTYAASSDASSDTQSPEQGKLVWPYPEQEMAAVNPDDPTDILTAEETCQDCEGEGFTETKEGSHIITRFCQRCKGDGLSELGRVRRSEDLVH